MSTEKVQSSTDWLATLIAKHKTTPRTSILVLVVFVIYLPFVYQVHLDVLAQRVIAGAWWPRYGLYLFPIPFDMTWIPFVVYLPNHVLLQLKFIDRFIYDYFIPNVGLRLLWSALWLLLGLVYIFRPIFPSLRSKGSRSSPADAD